MGTTRKGHGEISSSKHGTAFNLHRNKGHTSPSSNEGKSSEFPAFPKSATEAASGRSGGNSGVPNPSNVRPGVVYADDKPGDSTRSNEKPSDSSFFDATRSSENDDSGFESMNSDSKDKPSFDSDSFFDEAKSSEDDRSEFESVKPDSKDKPSFDSDSFFDEDKSSENDRSRFESINPDSKDKPSFDSDKSAESDDSEFEFEKSSHSDDKSSGSSSRFHNEKMTVENQKREFSGRSGVKAPFPGTPRFPLSSDKPFLAGTPKIKFVMGREASGRFSSRGPLKSGPLRKRVFRDGPTSFYSPHTLRDRVFYLSGAGDVPAYDFSSVYGPPASLLYDGGDLPLFLDGAGPEEGAFVFEKK